MSTLPLATKPRSKLPRPCKTTFPIIKQVRYNQEYGGTEYLVAFVVQRKAQEPVWILAKEMTKYVEFIIRFERKLRLINCRECGQGHNITEQQQKELLFPTEPIPKLKEGEIQEHNENPPFQRYNQKMKMKMQPLIRKPRKTENVEAMRVSRGNSIFGKPYVLPDLQFSEDEDLPIEVVRNKTEDTIFTTGFNPKRDSFTNVRKAFESIGCTVIGTRVRAQGLLVQFQSNRDAVKALSQNGLITNGSEGRIINMSWKRG